MQSVTRGELSHYFCLLGSSDLFSEVEFVTDNYIVHSNYNKGEVAAISASNCDLFREILDLAKQK